MLIQKTIYKTIAFGGLVLLMSCGTQNQSETVVPVVEKREAVRVQELQLQTITRSVEYPATLQGYEEIHLAPATPGRIDAIYAQVGDRVYRGVPLVEMDKTQLVQAQIQLRNIEADFRRLDTLAKVGSIAQQQYDQLETQYTVAKSNVEFLQRNTRLVAPFAGVISGRYFEPGEMFSGAPNTPVGKAAVLSLVQIDRLKALVALSENYFPSITVGMEPKVSSDIYPDKSFTGRIYRIHPTIDPTSRTFNVEVLIDNREGLLRPGMFSRVILELGEEQALLLPSVAVLKMQGSNDRYLFVERDGVARRIAVNLGTRFNDNVEVISDALQVGDRVIVNGQARLLDGMAVDVVR